MEQALPLLEMKMERIESLYVCQAWHDTNYRDAFTRLYLILGGEGEIGHSGERFFLNPGHIYLIPEYTRHDYNHDGNLQLFYLHCQIRTPGGLSFFDFYDCEYVINCRDTGLGFPDFEKLRRLAGHTDPASLLTVSSGLLHLLAPFVKGARSPRDSGKERDMARLMGVLNYMEEHLDEDPSVTNLASMVGMERSSFSRLFSWVMGISPGKFMQKKRIETARKLLTGSEMSCEEVGEKLGFYDASHFSRIFQLETGVRPGEFRDREIQV